MVADSTTTIDALKYQAIIGLIEPLARHVSFFARNDPAFKNIEHLLTPSFAKEIKKQRLLFIRKRLEMDPMSLFGILRFINEDGIYCEDQFNMMIEFFLKHYRPTQTNIGEITELQVTESWRLMSRKMAFLGHMHTFARNIDQEHPQRKDVLLSLGLLTGNLIATGSHTPQSIIPLLELANKTRYLDTKCL